MTRHTLYYLIIVFSNIIQVQAEENVFTPTTKYGKPSRGQNPFTQTHRMMPVDLPDTYSYSQTVNPVLPEGYLIEEIPQNQMIMTEQKGVTCRYIILKSENQMVLKYQFNVSQLHFTFQEYTDLQTSWAAVAEKKQCTYCNKETNKLI